MSEREPALGLDEAQEQRQGARRTVESSAVFWEELNRTTLPHEAKVMVFEAWLRFIFTPELKLPDFKDMFGKLGSDE